MTSEC